ncbi:hypothetical protein [Embleya sp. NPDC059237]|uniref:Orn/Lys/Arg family decarboxylase n=1 Tax=Embleya sp. NPDC059237 TaxID=3346784 RepID=UPI0036ACE066
MTVWVSLETVMAGSWRAIGAADGPLLRYLGALEAFDRHFPGFHSETHGVVDPENGDYRIECVHPDRENALGG